MGRPINQQDDGGSARPPAAVLLPDDEPASFDDLLIVLTGLPGTGKSSFLISSLKAHKEAGRDVSLLLSSESSHLTRRPNVAPGKLMGCRVPKLSFPITDVVPTQTAIELLETAAPGSVFAFDEAQYFQPGLVDYWLRAAQRGVYVLVGTPSARQLAMLQTHGVKPRNLNAPCAICGRVQSAVVIYKTNLRDPTQVCGPCAREYQTQALAALLADVAAGPPFAGRKRTHQPFYDAAMKGWTFVRDDAPARHALLRDALQRYPDLAADPKNPGKELTFADVGCSTGFFCDAMTNIGYTATGVDMSAQAIDWATRMALLKRQSIHYERGDVEAFLTSSNTQFDVMSTFSGIGQVTAERGEAAGARCLKALFGRTRHLCVIDMGATSTLGSVQAPGYPDEIDPSWTLDVMTTHGGFAHIERIPAGYRGLRHTVFVGFKNMPRLKNDLTLRERLVSRLRASTAASRVKPYLKAALKRS